MERPTFPERAVITGGMPYGNKELHFGHIGGVFVQADVFARFLRDRIGPDNVILSRNIVDLQIHKYGMGHVRDSYRRGWITRFLDRFNPF